MHYEVGDGQSGLSIEYTSLTASISITSSAQQTDASFLVRFLDVHIKPARCYETRFSGRRRPRNSSVWLPSVPIGVCFGVELGEPAGDRFDTDFGEPSTEIRRRSLETS